MEMMLAARYLGPNRIEAQEVFLPKTRFGEALLEIEACGFCGSDINIVAGTHPRARAPLTIGHEISGRITQLNGPASGFVVGDLVTSYPLISCGTCYACTHGYAHVCRQLRLFGFDVDGGMAQFVRLPIASLMKLPLDMPPSIGALIEPLAVAIHGVRRADLAAAEVVAVLGAGPIGILTALVAQARGVPHVLISDILQSRLELAQSLGLSVSRAGEDLRARTLDISGQNGADIVYECAGHPSSAREMTTLVRSRGTIVNIGVFKKPVDVDMQAINFKEISIVGSRVYERKDFEAAIDLAMKLPLDSLINREFALIDVSEAFRLFKAGKTCKVLILPTAGAR